MLDFSDFLARPELQQWRKAFSIALNERCHSKRWGDMPAWEAAVNLLPNVIASDIDLNQDTLKIGAAHDLTDTQNKQLIQALQNMMPWRKGPFVFFGTLLDTEWRSDWKWQRISPHLQDKHGSSGLADKKILDVGCGTGYHCWRMLGEGAAYVMGIDPSMRFAYQHAMAQKYIQSRQFDFLPIGIEDMPHHMKFFDTTFSMGILYHRKDPLTHLRELKSTLKIGGELILETLIIDEDYELVEDGIFTPKERYAKMRNVWTIATIPHLIESLTKVGFDNVRCIDINTTSTKEQRSTDWMTFQSLPDFLDKEDNGLTIEGYPAPKRATLLARNTNRN